MTGAVRLEVLGTFLWVAVCIGGAPLGPNGMASSLGGGKREVKEGEQ